MRLPAHLEQQLHALSAAVDDPDQNLALSVRALLDTWREAVPSFLGLALVLGVDGRSTTVSTLTGHRTPAVGASLRLPLPSAARSRTATDVVAYAVTPGAFVDLAADAAYILDMPLHSAILDQDLTPDPGDDPADSSTINHAAGVLIDQGHHPDTALSVLKDLATTAGVTLLIAAQQLLHSFQAGNADH